MRFNGAELAFAITCRASSMRASDPEAPLRSFGGSPLAVISGGLGLAMLGRVFGDEIDRACFQLREDLADIFANDADHDELHAADRHEADHQRGIARHLLAGREYFQRIESPNRKATAASSTPSKLAKR